MSIPSAFEFMKKHLNNFCSALKIIDFDDQAIFDPSRAQNCFNVTLTGNRNEMTPQLYQHLGSERYIIDIKKGRIEFDLNYSIRSLLNFHQIAHITTNHGTSEHVFNQYCFFEVMHLVTKACVYLFNVLNCQRCADENGYGHRFFLYQPKFLNLIAQDNNYGITDIMYNLASPSPAIRPYKLYEYSSLVLHKSWSSSPYPHFSSLLCLFRKSNYIDFVVPQEYSI